jgi:cell division protein FtsL
MANAHALGGSRWLSLAIGGLVLLVAAAVFHPRLLRSPDLAPVNRPAAASVQTYASSSSDHVSGTNAHEAKLSLAGILADQQVRVASSSAPAQSAQTDRKIIRTGSLEAVVKSPAEAAEQIRNVAERLGGYVESAQISSSQSAPTATITIRVPALRFEDAKAEIRKFAARIENEKTDATDVTKQYVDLQARIRNLRAEEAQYLTIMRSAGKVKDMLEVSEKVSDVRGEIEQQQAEFETLSKQVETVAISVLLRSEPVAPVAELHWRPLYQLKLAWHDALDGFADYANTMVNVVLYIPVVMLWVGTCVLGAVAVWKLLRWGARVFFAYPKAV